MLTESVKLYLGFYRKCAVEAARGTLAWANAWAWFWGLLIVSLICWWGSYEVVLPGKPFESLVFGIVLLGAALIVAFLLRMIGAPARLYGALSERHEQLEAAHEQLKASLRPKLELVADQKCLWTGTDLSISVGVRNLSDTTIRDVMVQLDRFVEGQGIANLPRNLRTREGQRPKFDLAPRQTEYMLIGRVVQGGRLRYDFVGDPQESSAPGSYKIKIKAYGDGTVPVNRFFPISFGDGGDSVSIADFRPA
jgi:hypothetical protein